MIFVDIWHILEKKNLKSINAVKGLKIFEEDWSNIHVVTNIK
jgi:hypothetical protein